MGIEDIQISEELKTNAPSIKYSGDEGPKSPQEMQQMMMAQLQEEYLKYVDDMMEQGLEPMTLQQFMDQAMAEGQMSGGQPLPQDPTKPVNPFAPKPTGPVLPDRQTAAYGGIMGVDGRKKYGIGSWFQENIMDPIKENPVLAAAAAYLGYDTYQNQGESILGKGLGAITKERTRKVDGKDETYTIGGDVAGLIGKNIVPIVGGLGAGLFTKNTESDNPGVPDDQTGIDLQEYTKAVNLLDQKQGMASGANFLPTVASRKYSPTEMIDVYQNAANGGRIGYQDAGPVVDEQTTQMILDMNNRGMDVDTISTITQQNVNTVNAILSAQNKKAEGGIMDLGGMEKDYRAEGGFVPIGKQEKADDVPARLSVNEFVFTADAVRNAGGGDIDQGAQVMENMMKHLEQGGQVSEESQGMAGARDMFATSERLSEVV